MKLNMYAVYDKIAMEFAPPYLGRNDAVAIRGFKTLMSTEKVQVPNDFRLYRIGEFDADNGVIIPLNPPKEVFSPGSTQDQEIADLVGAGG